ncbi:MAG TPA: ABC transporter ATP-binding protein [Xanthomonadales bacterium]|nr:ABC transporter ATP-binding protein [Xanthomonadales bacterium]
MERSNFPAIRVSGLFRHYQEGDRQHQVLRGIDLDIQQGETVALRGRSGSGKSTLLNLISGIDAPDDGQVVVAGQDITELSENDRTIFRRSHIGFIYQAFNLIPTLDVSDNLRLVLELNRVSKEETAQRIEQLLGAVGLLERAGSYPDILSGGEQQRVAIARALCHRPKVLIADEPTGNLDDKTAGRVLDLLENLVRENGHTMLVATHSVAVASRCDRIIELHDGKLEEVRKA